MSCAVRLGRETSCGGSFPDEFVSILRMQDAAVSRNEKSIPLASVQDSLDSHIAAKQMSRLFEPCGGPARQDVLAATDCDTGSAGEDLSYKAWGARQEAKQRGKIPPEGNVASRAGREKLMGMAKCSMAKIDAPWSATVTTHVVVSITRPPRALSNDRGSQTARPVRLL